MQSVLNMKSVGSGMAVLLDTFCKKNDLKSPVYRQYAIDERIPFNIWLDMLKLVDDQYRQEGLGLDIARYCNAGHVGISAYMARACGSLANYMDLPRQYVTLWYDQAPKQIYYNDRILSISWKQPDYYRAGYNRRETDISNELKVAIIYQRIKQMTGISKRILSGLNLAISKPRNVKKYEEYFDTSVSYDIQQSTIKIYEEIYHYQFSEKDPILCEILKRQADSMIENLPVCANFIDLVEQAVIRSINNQTPRLSIVASDLNMTARGLQNLLKENGVCFQDILNSVRLKLAKRYLRDRNISILEISNLLGYREQTSFNRIFKSWYGVSPLQWRDKYCV